MTTEEKLNFLVATINSTDKISAYEFNFNSDVRKAYCLMYSEEVMLKQLEKEQPNNYNKFCSLDYTLKNFIETNNIEIRLANSYINKIENYYTRNWRKIDLVKYATQQAEIEIAEQITSEIPDEDSGPGQYLAHRHILEYYASIGDIKNFKSKTKPSKLGKYPRYGIEAYKYKLIEGIAKRDGIIKTFEIIEDKYFEKTPSIGILRWSAHLLTINEIDEYLKVYPRVLNETNTARADLYVLHFREQSDVALPQDIFDKTLTEVLKTDKDAKCGDLRCRDALLIDLGASTLYEKQALECKKHIVSPIAKRELNYAIQHKRERKKYIS